MYFLWPCVGLYLNLDIGEGQGNQGEEPMYSDPTDSLLKSLHSFPDSISIRYVADIKLFIHDLSELYIARLVRNGSWECLSLHWHSKAFWASHSCFVPVRHLTVETRRSYFFPTIYSLSLPEFWALLAGLSLVRNSQNAVMAITQTWHFRVATCFPLWQLIRGLCVLVSYLR